MKKNLLKTALLALFLTLPFTSCSKNKKDSKEDLIKEMNTNNRYKLYPTKNKYTFLELDTQTGKIKQVQWSLDNNEGYAILNDTDLSSNGKSNFELYPTENYYTFILLDKTNGKMWHVQWSTEKGESGILGEINNGLDI